jgi:hypothetical protein
MSLDALKLVTASPKVSVHDNPARLVWAPLDSTLQLAVGAVVSYVTVIPPSSSAVGPLLLAASTTELAFKRGRIVPSLHDTTVTV